MLCSWLHDLLTLARVALEAAIRNEGDLIELLPAIRRHRGDQPGKQQKHTLRRHDAFGPTRVVRATVARRGALFE
jgi:hypothetical protein